MLLTVLLISGTILGATTIAGLLMLYQLRQATNFGQSVQALFAADTGLEWQLYRLFVDETRPKPKLSASSMSDFEVEPKIVQKDNLPPSIRSVGCAGAVLSNIRPDACPRSINRAFELIFQWK